jgi:hypothetical protein
MTRSTNKPQWRRSQSCNTGACVEVARVGDHYLVRDSKNPQVPPLTFTVEEWQSFTEGVLGGDFDLG